VICEQPLNIGHFNKNKRQIEAFRGQKTNFKTIQDSSLKNQADAGVYQGRVWGSIPPPPPPFGIFLKFARVF